MPSFGAPGKFRTIHSSGQSRPVVLWYSDTSNLYLVETLIQGSVVPLSESQMETAYSDDDLDLIAKAIAKPLPVVKAHSQKFNAAAMWYRLDSRSPTQVAPSVLKRKLDPVRNAARRLLNKLGIQNMYEAADGPQDVSIFDALASVDGMTPDTVASATDRIGRMAAVLDGISATREIEHLAKEASEVAERVGELIVPKGHHGDAAVNNWTAAMMSIYRDLTGSLPRTSVISPGRENAGDASGPLIRFLEAAGQPLSIHCSANAWRSRIRGILKISGC